MNNKCANIRSYSERRCAIMIVFLSKYNFNIILFFNFAKYVTAIMTTSKSLLLYMVLGIAIGVVLFIIYEKQRHSMPIDGELERYTDISNVPEANHFNNKFMQDYDLQTNENRGAKTCPHKYVDIFHLKEGIHIKNNDASALLFCTKEGYPNSGSCSQNTCDSCISYKKEFESIDNDTSNKFNTLNKYIQNQKNIFDGLEQPIQDTITTLKNQINRRQRLIGKVKANIQDAKELDASIQTLEEKKNIYENAKKHCKTQPNSRFYRNIIARERKPSNKHIDMAKSTRDSIDDPPPEPYNCWSTHKVPQIFAIYGFGPLPSFAKLIETATQTLGFKFEVVRNDGKVGKWLIATPFVHDAIKNTRNGKALNVNNKSMKGDPFFGKEKYLVIFNDSKVLFRVNEHEDFTVAQQRYIRSLLYGDYTPLDGDCGGNNIKKFKNINSINKCKNICNTRANCKGFTYSSKLKECIPKKKSCSNPTRSGKDGWKFYEKPPMILRP